jgi:hypothetical protein
LRTDIPHLRFPNESHRQCECEVISSFFELEVELETHYSYELHNEKFPGPI